MRLVQSIEAAGFDGAGILDSQMLGRDTFVILGQAAAHTSGDGGDPTCHGAHGHHRVPAGPGGSPGSGSVSASGRTWSAATVRRSGTAAFRVAPAAV